jgi:hypothetical protein
MVAAEGRPDRPTSSTLVGGAATRCAALAEPVSSEAAEAVGRRSIRLALDPATPEGEARAGGGDSDVTNPTVYNRSIYKYNLIDVYKYNLINAL